MRRRYSRPAFPDELVERLRIVNDDFRKAARKHGDAAIGVFVDFEPSGEINNTEEPYEIGISVVFDGTKKDAAATSRRLRDALNSLFEKAYRQASGQWKGIELVRCEAMPDTEFTYFEAMRSHPYRLDDLSLRRTPHEPVPL